MVRWTSRLVLLAPLLAACSSKWTYVDQDGDGVSAAEGDCWDSSASPPGSSLTGADIFPGAPETWYDGFDQDCAGDHDFDQDADGFVADEWAAQAGELAVGDCDDARAEVNPLAADEFYDGVDSDCGGQDDFDQDGDGYVPAEYAGQVTQYVEGSGGLPGGDCDDLLADVSPAASDDWYDGVDSDCGGEDDYDQDGDGYVPLAYEGLETRYVDGSGLLEAGDCDDTDPGRVPDDTVPVVWYNGYDERCDENDGDQDGDGFWAEDYEDRVAASASGFEPLAIPAGRDGDCFDDAADRPDDGDLSDELVPLNGGDLLDPDQVFPGADDDAYDGVDADCQDDSDFDKDGDGYDSQCTVQRDGSTGTDCLDSDEPADCGDADPAGLGALGVYPGAIDSWYDGTDANCDDYDDWDADYDGFIPDGYAASYTGSFPDGDCDDLDDEVNPAESDTWYDGQDTDCSGNDDYDRDGDGYVPDAYAGRATEYVSGSGGLPDGDCDDTLSTVNPGRTDTWYDGVDTDCSGNEDYDRDADGYVPDAYAGLETQYVSGSGDLPDGDCDDTLSTVNPGRTDTWYDGVDTNCGENDDYDRDGDGYVPDAYAGLETEYVDGSGSLPDGDCDDTVSTVNPGRTDTWYDGTDTNCSGNDDYDQDADGYVPDAYAGRATTYVSGSGSLPDGDCDDTAALVNPSRTDTWYDGIDTNCSGNDDYDRDSDGYVPDAYAGRATTYVSGSGSLPDGDCDDTVSTVNPGRTDTWYDGVDTNCSGDDDYDRDADGYVPDAYAGRATTYVSGSGSLPDGDCDDTVSTVNPGRTDTWYDGVDTNCSGNDDYDRDGDSYVPDAYAGRATTYVSGSGGLPDGDCDDTVSTVNPGRSDAWYDGTDTNCSGNDDYDQDGDSYVPDAYVGLATLYVSGSGGLPGNDCNDLNAAVNPAATEVWYDGTDQDCDDWSDYDADLDGQDHESYGGNDCNDANDDVYYGATETCSTSYDDDCDDDDNDRDAAGCSTFNYDGDGDTYGTTSTRCYCEANGSWRATNDDDCNDAQASTYPGAPDAWYDGVDSNCAGNSDYDQDGDSFDAEAYGGTDCNDLSASIKPGATDLWYDGIDSNCDDASDYDRDGDGFDWETYGGEDCDDGDEDIRPTATEIWYDGVDQDCDDESDYDRDGDGYDSESYGGEDCNDALASVNPDQTEVWYDGVDADCSGTSDYDADGDGDNSDAWFGGDCDDTDPTISSLEPEIADGADQDCDEWIDEDFVSLGDLIISEAMINSVDSTTPEQYEWFEVYNRSADTLYLDGWEFEELRDGTATPTGNSFWVSPDASLSIDSGQYLVFCYRDDTPGLPCDYEYGSNLYSDSMYGGADHGSWILANGNAGAINIFLGSSTMDTVPFTASFPYANGKAVELAVEMLNATDNDDIDNWCTASNLFATSADGDSYGTPGEENDCTLP